MTRKLKTLGLALVAVFAMSAVAASTASAVDLFTAEVGTALVLTGSQEGAKNIKFKVGGQTVECETATFAGGSEGASLNKITGVTPTYSGCSLAGVPVTIDPNGCTYDFYNTTDAALDTTTKIEGCGGHITMTITGISCDITLKAAAASNGNQTATEGVRFINIGATTTRELTIVLTAKLAIKVHTWPEKAMNATCATIEPATTGRYTGQITFTATEKGTGNHKGIFVS